MTGNAQTVEVQEGPRYRRRTQKEDIRRSANAPGTAQAPTSASSASPPGVSASSGFLPSSSSRNCPVQGRGGLTAQTHVPPRPCWTLRLDAVLWAPHVTARAVVTLVTLDASRYGLLGPAPPVASHHPAPRSRRPSHTRRHCPSPSLACTRQGICPLCPEASPISRPGGCSPLPRGPLRDEGEERKDMGKDRKRRPPKILSRPWFRTASRAFLCVS